MTQSATALTVCDREPIHLSGAVQPFGCLLAINSNTNTVEFISKNVSDFLGRDLKELLGMSGDDVQTLIDNVPTGHVHRYLSGDYAILEIEAAAQEVGAAADALLSEIQYVSAASSRSVAALDSAAAFNSAPAVDSAAALDSAPALNRAPAVDSAAALDRVASSNDLSQRMAEAVQRLTGFARIMIYKFADDWTGTVIAEKIDGDMPSFLDLRFPSTDIPVQARRLYSENLLRYIPDVNALPVPIEPSSLSTTLNLSQSEVRSVSPIHIEYLKNMQVGASMSLSVMVEGRLWGLIACHHPVALHLNSQVREHCVILGQLYARLLTMQEQTDREKRRADAKVTQIALLDKLSRCDSLIDGMREQESLLLKLTHASGAVLKTDSQLLALGVGSDTSAATKIMETLHFEEGSVLATDNLSLAESSPELSGVVAIELAPDSWLMWTRPEVISEVSWAGEPLKTVVEGDSERLHPRRSFAVWKETVSGKSNPWTEEELQAADALRQFLKLKIERDKAESERSRLTVAVKDSNQKLAQFVDTIAHDLRSPLISIGNLAQWVQKDLADVLQGEPRDNLLLLQKRASKMREQLNELLEYSKAGNFRAEPVNVNVKELVETIVDGFGQTNKFEFVVGDLPALSTVKAPLEHVFYNLIDNACKHSSKAGGRIEIGGSDKGEYWEFFVADQGQGIPAEFLDEIFLPLRSLQNADTENHGMGLAFVKRIVEQAGGTVQVDSAPNAGARFSFTWRKVWRANTPD